MAFASCSLFGELVNEDTSLETVSCYVSTCFTLSIKKKINYNVCSTACQDISDESRMTERLKVCDSTDVVS